MTPQELPALFEDIILQVKASTQDDVMAMADAYKDYLTQVTLRRYTHVAGTRTPSPRGSPPAWVSGELASTVVSEFTGYAGDRATAEVYPTVKYARVQELGMKNMRPTDSKFLHWHGMPTKKTPTGSFYLRSVTVPPRPYMAPALRDTIDKGLLTTAAAETFEQTVWGRLVGRLRRLF